MRLASILAALLFSTSVSLAQDDPVVMRIGDGTVRLSEFVYAYHKNYPAAERNEKSLQAFADRYLAHKLKVQAAIDARLDTLASVRGAFQSYQGHRVVSALGVDPQVEGEARFLYETARDKVTSSGGQVKVAHILLALRQNATDRQRREAQRRADSIYQAIKAGADFGEMARRFSDDKATAQNGGELPWLAKGQTVETFEKTAFSLKEGEMSRPFLSEFGYHIVWSKGRQSFYPFESQRDELCRYVETQALREAVRYGELPSSAQVAMQEGSTVSVSGEFVNAHDEGNLSPLMIEYRDGILSYAATHRYVWQRSQRNESAQASYFKRHKKDYRWDQPRFQGVAFYVRTYADAKKARQLLKGKPFARWKNILERHFNHGDEVNIMVADGLFVPGDHPLVDRDIYKRGVKPSPYSGLHIGITYGKVLRKGPEDYTAVRQLVLADYQEQLEKDWIAALRKHYRPSIDWHALARAL